MKGQFVEEEDEDYFVVDEEEEDGEEPERLNKKPKKEEEDLRSQLLRGFDGQAYVWEDLVWMSEELIGREAMEIWVECVEQTLMNKDYFIKNPEDANFLLDKNLDRKGKTWVSPHPDIQSKMGYYIIWRPNGDIEEASDEDGVLEKLE